jgi:hypothetical protein
MLEVAGLAMVFDISHPLPVEITLFFLLHVLLVVIVSVR